MVHYPYSKSNGQFVFLDTNVERRRNEAVTSPMIIGERQAHSFHKHQNVFLWIMDSTLVSELRHWLCIQEHIFFHVKEAGERPQQNIKCS